MFSIIIPLYNKQKSIIKTLQSVQDQTLTQFEVIVIDDGSTDSGFSIVQEMLNSDKRIRLLQKKNGGVSSARNEGVRQSKYNLIAFIDADDLWEPNYLTEQSHLISEFPSAELWGCGWGIIEDQIKKPVIHPDYPDGFKGVIKDYFRRKSQTNLFWISIRRRW